MIAIDLVVGLASLKAAEDDGEILLIGLVQKEQARRLHLAGDERCGSVSLLHGGIGWPQVI
jgi:hypothetical protein